MPPPLPKLRVGIVDYLNAWPLAWDFLSGALADEAEAIYLPPARVASELAAGRLDLGLIPSIEAQRLADLRVVPGLCVAATHEVRSVILVSKGPIEEVASVALDRNSRTSAALVQILLAERYGLAAEIEVASPDAEEMLRRADAALIIGDPALHVDRERYRVWDLAAEWRSLTGRPFVFAFWAARAAVSERVSRLEPALRESLRSGLVELPRIVARAVERLGLGRAEVETYLTQNLSFVLDEPALEGLRLFYSKAAAAGLIETAVPLRFLGEKAAP